MIVAAVAAAPTLMWSPRAHFAGGFREYSEQVDAGSVKEAVASLLESQTHRLLEDTKTRSTAPKSVVMFVDQQGSWLDGVRQAMTGAESAASLPAAEFVHSDLGRVGAVEARHVSSAEELRACSDKPPLVVVNIGREPAGLLQAVDETFGKDYVGLYSTANTMTAGRRLESDSKEPKKAENSEASAVAEGAAIVAAPLVIKLMVSPSILSGLLCGVLWLILFFTGFCCLFAVQTPVGEYEKECLKINKEY